MIWKIVKFELNYWRKRPITYIFPFIIFLQSLLSLTLNSISIGSDIVYRNSPYSIMVLYWVSTLILPLFVSSFVSSSITRDYENKFDQIIYSLPILKVHLLVGRFIGSSLIVALMFLGILLADVVAPIAPWADLDLLGPFRFDAHLKSFLLIGIPNVFIIGSILFLIASFTRSMNYSFLGAISIVVVYLSLQGFNESVDNKTIASLSDPYGFTPIVYFTKKWSAFEKNNLLFQVDWKFWLNRLIWLGVSFILWLWALKRGTKLQMAKSSKVKKKEADVICLPSADFPAKKDFSYRYILKNLHFQAKIDLLHIVRSPAFIIVLGLLAMVLGLEIVGNLQSDRPSDLATTTNTIDVLFSINIMLQLALIYFSGMLIWKERDNKVNEIFDSLPVKTAQVYIGKLLSMIYFHLILASLLILTGVLYQVLHGVMIIDWTHYWMEYFVKGLFLTITSTILSMMIQILVNNKFVAYFISCLLIIVERYILEWIDINSNLFSISPSLPSVVHSDFYGYGHYLTPLLAFMLYWLLVYAVLAYLSYLFFVRGLGNWKSRFREASQRFIQTRWIGIGSLLFAISWGGYLYYQTKHVNTFYSRKERLERSAYYEKHFKKLEDMPIPKVVHVDYRIDLFGKERKYKVKGSMKLVNTSDTTIDRIYINNDVQFPFQLNIPYSRLIHSDKKSHIDFQTYQFEKPLLPGDSLGISFVYDEFYKGIEDEISNKRLTPNGTFLDYGKFTPMLGYQPSEEISDKSDREKYGLPVKAEQMPKLERNCTKNCQKDYIGGMSDWATIHTVISTHDDQTAIAPGRLVQSWKNGNRNFFEYNLSQPSKFFFSVVSGNFEVERDSVLGILCEVYYLKQHKNNVAEMMKSLKKSISYYFQQFGPYRHHEARIIEFPRFSSFAQAFPGTMPYSESIGFTSNIIENPKDINEIFHVVAHEMAHQWWAHQVTGAFMQGATLLSESLAEYSSLKLLELEYGLDMASKFLKDANNGYIFSRAGESMKESSLQEVDNQGYIHYNKGSVILYGIQQLLGENKFNTALSQVIKKYAYKNPPYPTSYALLDEIYPMTPDSFRETVQDGFERIILFQADIKDAKTVQRKDGMYETKLNLSLIKNSIDPNAKQTKDIKQITIGQSREAKVQDYFDIALFESSDDQLRYGKEIYKKRIWIDSKNSEWVFVTRQKPDKLVVDPYFIHIHKDPEDNIVKL